LKDTFYNLNEEKKKRVIDATLEEFALSGYEKTSLDTIISRAGISKGGLYEYIESKEDLFRYALTYSYNELYVYINKRVESQAMRMPADPLERTRFISSVAVDFYIENPDIIAFIVNSSQTGQASIRKHVQEVFDSYFSKLYESSSYQRIVYESDQVLSLLKWLLVKTRDDFQKNMNTNGKSAACKELYLAEWKFFLSVLSNGIYDGEFVSSVLK